MADSDKANYALSAHTAALTDNAKAVRKLLSQLKEATLAENENEITRIAAQLFWNHGNSGHNYAVKFQNYVLELDKSIGGTLKNQAEDIAQETCWKIIRSIEKYDETRAGDSWMMKICKRTALDWLGKKGVTTISLDEVSEETFIDDPAEPQVAVGNPEQQQFVTDILESLTPAELSVIDNLEHIDRRSKKWRDLRKRLRENVEANGGLRRYYALGNDFKE